MSKTKLPIIKPQLGFVGMSDDDLLKRLNAVHDGMLNNPAYPSPPIDMPGFKAAIDALTAAVSSMLDGGKSATVERNKRRADVIIMLRLLGHYVEAVCKNDMTTFVSSGFVPATTVRNPTQPVTPPLIVSVDQGSSGQLVVTIKNVAGARSYELRYAAVAAAGTAVNWNTIVVPSTKPPTAISNLTPGGNYTFQVRAFGKLGFSDWSALVERMCF
jgi:hypothetical protein